VVPPRLVLVQPIKRDGRLPVAFAEPWCLCPGTTRTFTSIEEITPMVMMMMMMMMTAVMHRGSRRAD
jgi:hypothetical protein